MAAPGRLSVRQHEKIVNWGRIVVFSHQTWNNAQDDELDDKIAGGEFEHIPVALVALGRPDPSPRLRVAGLLMEVRGRVDANADAVVTCIRHSSMA
jgi:hypothetical protein